MSTISRFGFFVLVALVLIGGSFAAASSDFAFSSQSLLAAAISTLSSKPEVSISRNINSPRGIILPGRSQVLAVFDVKQRGLTQVALVPQVTTRVNITGSLLQAKNFLLLYHYCLPKGDVYAYGYKYGYSGVYCTDTSLAPSSIVQSGSSYLLTFTDSGGTLRIYPNQVASLFTVVAYPYYSSHPPQSRSERIQATISGNVTTTTNVCKVIRYGYRNRYGYAKCSPVTLPIKTSLAYGNVLTVDAAYGYGYKYPTKPTTPGSGPTPTSTSTQPTTPPTVTPPPTTPPPAPTSTTPTGGGGGGKLQERTTTQLQ